MNWFEVIVLNLIFWPVWMLLYAVPYAYFTKKMNECGEKD